MQFSTFFSVAFVFGVTLAAEQQVVKCSEWDRPLIGQYAYPMFTNATHCRDTTVRCLPGGGYEKCTNNKFFPMKCECESHQCHKGGQFLQCQP
ncbi:hypothetical protein DSO57_1014101 [Entomophthora muscae]|uniref:Uncharacterized protein n=1 Tax=Entomophthora muscae TaxID=34485 RepID=A0ACC2UQW4_9FUNG|nr:hypothetical protein DSO57_1014101 [Entomophthora muscae]